MIFAFLDDLSQLPTYLPNQLTSSHINIQIPLDIPEEEKPFHVLKTVFGYEEFRAGQLEAIQAILNGDDCVVRMPTGGGKSMLYVIPSIIKQELTIVIQPLKFLMEEQVSSLRKKGNTCSVLQFISQKGS